MVSDITDNHRAGGDLVCSNDNNKVSSSTTGSQENKQPRGGSSEDWSEHCYISRILERGGWQLEKLYKRRGILRMIGNLRADSSASVTLNILT